MAGRTGRPGEFVAAVEVPRLADDQRYFAHKISKRFDSDISAVMAAFRLTFDGETVSDARLAFGGMAGTPKRAPKAEAALIGRRFDAGAVAAAMAALGEDFAPLTDMRASDSLSPEVGAEPSEALPARTGRRGHPAHRLVGPGDVAEVA